MATIRKRNGKWQVQVRLTGFGPRSASFATKSKAIAWGLDTETRLLSGGEDKKDVRQLKGMTFGDLAKSCYESGAITQTNIPGYNSLLSDPIASEPLVKITRKTAKEWYDRQSKTLKPDSIRRYATVPRGIWDYGLYILRLPIDADNPFRRLGIKLKENRRQRRLSGDELERLLSVSDDELKDIINWAIETGMRRGEISKAAVFHIQNDKYLHIPETKTERPRTIPLTKTAQQIVKRRMERGFRSRLFPYTGRRISKEFKAAVDLAKITNLRFHDLRHEALSRLNAKGLSVFDIQLVSGHKSVKCLEIYIHPELKRVGELLEI